MAYETTSLHRHDTYAIYTIHAGDDERAALLAADDPTAMITEILAAGGAPPPNEVIVHKLSSPDSSRDSTESIQDQFDQWLKDVTSGGGGTPAPQPPVAVLYHQESGAHISRYITIVISPK